MNGRPLFLPLSLFLLLTGAGLLYAQNKESIPDTVLINSFLEKGANSSGDTSIRMYQSAISTAEHSLKTRRNRKTETAITRKLIKARLSLGLVHYNKLEYQPAMELFSKALHEAETIGDLRLEADSYFNIAEVYLEQSRFSGAMENYNLALIRYRNINDMPDLFWCYTGMGIVQKLSGNYRDAEVFYSKALHLATGTGMDYEEATCYNNLGNLYRKTGDFTKAMESYQKAIGAFQKQNDQAAISDCLNNIGNLFSDHSDPFRALDYYRQSLAIATKLADEYRLFIRYKNMAGAYLELRDYENAGQFLDDALKLAEKSGDKSFLASCNMQFGKLHASKDDNLIAAAYFRKSADLYGEAGARPEQGDALIELAGTSLRQNLIRDAIAQANEALQIAIATGSLRGRLEANLCLSACYEKAGSADKAFVYLKNASTLRDSIYTADKYRTIEEIEAGFEHSELKKQNEALNQLSLLQKQAIHTKNIVMLLEAAILLLGLALIWLIFRRVRSARREAGRIRQQSEEKIGQLSEDLNSKERELTSKTIFINQKNQLLEKLIGELDELKRSDVSAQSIQSLQNKLKQELAPHAWKEFEVQFNEVHPGFQGRLLQNYPGLSPAERRLCAFIRLDMNTREIASLTGQSIKSIEVARTRIRKKLGVPHELNLTNFIASI